MADTDEEQAWIRASREGCHESFEKLIQRYQVMIHALTYRMTGSMAEAEDLAQETFIQAFQQVGTFRGESSFSTWLHRIAINKCLNWRGRMARRDKAFQEWAVEREEGPARADEGLTQQVQAALLKLDAKQRAAIALTVYEGMNHAEAAAVLGCSETTVSWRVFMARRKLKGWLEPLAKTRATV